MTIDNSLNSAKINLIYYIVAGLFVILAIYAIVVDIPDNHYSTSYIAVFMLCLYGYLNLKRPFFLKVEENAVKIIFRYYFLHPLLNRPRVFEFPKTQLAKYEIVHSWGGFRKDLFIYQKSNKGIVKYPGISITAFNKQDFNDLEKILNRVLIQNKKF